MESIVEAMPHVAAYKPALMALAILCVTVYIQSFLTAPFAFVKAEQLPGMPLAGDHTQFSFRVIRTYMNSVENLPAFGLSVLLAVMLQLDAGVVNWLAGIHVAFRMVFWAVYYSGVGKVAGGPRTISYVGGLLSSLVLAGYVIFALF